MANKEAILLCVDNGHLMAERFTDNMSRFQVAFECVNLTLQQKLFNNPNHEMGIALFGDDETDDGNSLMLQEIAKPSLDLVRHVQQLVMTEVKNKLPGGDLFETIWFGMGKLNEHVGTKKFNKRLFVFTHGGGRTKYDSSKISHLRSKLIASNIKLNVITIDFMEGYDPDTNTIHGSSSSNSVQEHNAELLLRLKSTAESHIQIIPASMAIELYKQFRKKDTTPIAQFRGTLEIAPGLGIEVATFKKVREFKPKSLKKYNMKEELGKGEGQNPVLSDVTYHVADDPTCEVIESDNHVNGYQYGKDIIPISGTMQAATKIFEQKCFKILGFVGRQKIPRQALINNIDMVIPTDDPASRKLFSAFIFSMLTLNRYALARYIPRNMKNGVSPKLMVLIPYRAAKGECFYMTQLPTAEDIRDYQFQTLRESNTEQQNLIKQLVNQMDLCDMTDSKGETFEALKPKSTFNPYNQYLFQTVFFRTLNSDKSIPPLNPQIADYLNTQKQIYARTQPLCEKIKSAFNVLVKEVKEKSNTKLIWKEAIKNSEGSISTEMAEESAIDGVPAVVGKKFAFEEEDVIHINPSDPITSFRKMITNNHMDLVSRALSELMKYIEQKVAATTGSETHSHILECIKELRVASSREREEDAWDNWLANNLKTLPDELAIMVKQDGVGYLKRSNADMFKPETQKLTKLVQQLDMDDLD